MYGLGVAIADYNNDGFADLLVTCVGQNRLFRNTGKGTFLDAPKSGLDGRHASALRLCGSISIATASSISSSATM